MPHPYIIGVTVTLVGLLTMTFAPAAEAVRFSREEWKFTADIKTGFDDNITSDEDNTEADVFSRLAASARWQLQSKITEAWLQAGIRQNVFFGNSDFNNTALSVQGRYAKEPSKYEKIEVANTLTRADEADSFEDEFGRQTGRYTYYDNRFKAGYRREISDDLTVKGDLANRIYLPSRSGLSDSIITRLGLTGEWDAGTHTVLKAFYSLTHNDFNPGTTAWINSVAGGVKRLITQTLAVEAKLGLNLINDFNDDTEAGGLFEIALIDNLNAKTQTLVLFRTESTVNNSTADVFDSWRLQGGFNRELTRQLNGEASAFIGEGEYDALGIKDQLLGARLGVAYEIAEDIDATANYTFSMVDSNSNNRSYTKNVILLGIRSEW